VERTWTGRCSRANQGCSKKKVRKGKRGVSSAIARRMFLVLGDAELGALEVIRKKQGEWKTARYLSGRGSGREVSFYPGDS